jgi:branched-subunit amino acid ABC-type transport system permease component
MRGVINFAVGTISTLGVSQTLLASQQTTSNTDFSSALNTVVSILGGILSTVVVAYIQHRWRIKEDDRKWLRDHPIKKLKKKD